ncbi:hypothetical protein HDU76_010657 [Blyttiomyces sp. JEL0837]|nr:hypothetical protein HDU76_010657 [Blyttiomyces sp. JEL0837]
MLERKNISFGLFAKTDSGRQLVDFHGSAVEQGGDRDKAVQGSLFSRNSTANGRLSQTSHETADSQSGHPKPEWSAQSSFGEVESNAGASNLTVSPMPRRKSSNMPPTPASLTKANPNTAVDPELTELIPIAHYDSSTYTVKGSYLVTEPGVYVLLFDNTFSLNTSKKLFFFVTLKEADPANSVKGDIEGWILKKGNRKMQGYARRWMKIDSDGYLSYAKQPGGERRANVPLKNTAVRLDHGQSLMHLKAQNRADFQMWVTALQSHVESKSMNLATDQEWRDRPLYLGADVSENDIDSVQKRTEEQIGSILKDLTKLKEFIQSANDRHDIKNFKLIMGSLSDLTSGLTNSTSMMQRNLSSYAQTVKNFRERNVLHLRETDLAFRNCLADNNKIRKKFGLNQVTAETFFVSSESVALRDVAELTGSLGSSLREDKFFDAEVGESDEDSFTSDKNFDDHDDGAMASDYDYEDDVAPYDDDEDEDEKALPDRPGEAYIVPDKKTAVAPQESVENNHSVVVEAVVAKPMETKIIVQRRKSLPAPTVSMENISVLSILRNNVGKDLSTVAMPIALNEPINLLQKLAEELEYCDLLDVVAKVADPVDRIVLIAAFAVSGYASTVNRAGRKPFNPLLGETYECIRDDKGFRFVSEKVSHHPPVMACFAESPTYQFYQDNLVKTRFWGKSMELIPSGNVKVFLKDFDELYVWNKGLSVVLNFKESGYFTSSKNEIAGMVVNSKGEEIVCLSGKWDENLCKFHKSSPNNLEVVWRSRPCPANHAQMYGFTGFTVELNELTEDLNGLLPSTDTRFRPDQRMYEEGKVDDAEKEKLRLEQKQREYRKKLEAEGKKWIPQWFELVPSEGKEEEPTWRYKGGYFEARGKFEEKIDLFT